MLGATRQIESKGFKMTVQTTRDSIDHARKLIEEGKYVVDTDWSESQPSTDDENRFLEKHDWDEYANWHLAKDSSDDDKTKERYMFPYGDFKKVHRSGLIAAKQRAAQNHYDNVEKAADRLLQMIDERENKK
jgi:hypothetical protein